MIEYITGEVTDLTPATAVVECMGIGYLLNISLNTYSCLSKGQATRLYVYEAIREDAYQLYGFYDRHERDFCFGSRAQYGSHDIVFIESF